MRLLPPLFVQTLVVSLLFSGPLFGQIAVVTPPPFDCVAGFNTDANAEGWTVVFTQGDDDPRNPQFPAASPGTVNVANGRLNVDTDGDPITAWFRAPAAFITDIPSLDAFQARFDGVTDSFSDNLNRPDGGFYFYQDNNLTVASFSDDVDSQFDPGTNTFLVSANFTNTNGTPENKTRSTLGTSIPAATTLTDVFIRVDFAGSGSYSMVAVDQVQKTTIDRFNFGGNGLGWSRFSHDELDEPQDVSGRRNIVSDAGNTGGSIVGVQSSQGDIVFLQAPATILGDWTDTIEFDIDSIATVPLPNEPLVPRADLPFVAVLSGPGGLARFQLRSVNFNSQNTGLNIPIDENQWTVASGTWDALLADVTGFFLRYAPFSNAAQVDSMRFPVTVGSGRFRRIRCGAMATTIPPMTSPVVMSSVDPAIAILGNFESGQELELQRSFNLKNWDVLASQSRLIGFGDPNAASFRRFFRRDTNVAYYRLQRVENENPPNEENPADEGEMLAVEFEGAGEQVGLTTVFSSEIVAPDDLDIVQVVVRDNNRLQGADGIYSGFDLDFVFLDADGDLGTTNDRIFPEPRVIEENFGSVRDREESDFQGFVDEDGRFISLYGLFGLNGVAFVDESVATLNTLDAQFVAPALLVEDSSGFLSLGDGGQLRLTFDRNTNPAFLNAGDRTFLMVGEAGLQDGENLASDVTIEIQMAAGPPPPVDPPRLEIAREISFSSVAMRTYQVQFSTDNGVTWTDVGATIAGNGDGIDSFFTLEEAPGQLRVIDVTP